MRQVAYDRLLELARRASRSPDADDLLQDALIEALAAGRGELERPENRRWLYGVIRNKARMAVRSAVRRRKRETDWSALPPQSMDASDAVGAMLAELPPALKSVAVLALTGHTRREIAWLLRLEDAALRQRVSALRRHMRGAGIALPAGLPGLNLDLAYGAIRDALLPLLVSHDGMFASHDPDGHLFVVRRSQNR